ncbi:hypothetical protein AB1Y20_007621 [Prymnesium parvum]|uniref:Peptidase A1 domain-containing protein n=1 Tax=Prymnesium parvum TaxID=97485 RepID=A0AB34IYA3_PRYPA
MAALLPAISALSPATPSLLGWARNETCVLSTNYGNSQYTAEIRVGTPAQTLHAIPDSGSFELLMTSTACKGCDGHPKFDASLSSSFVRLGSSVETRFGQGDVYSTVNYDRVQLGDLAAPRQSILLMQQNDLLNFDVAAYDAVMGMGRDRLARFYSDDLSLMASLHADVTGICVGQHDMEPGRLQVGGEVPGLQYATLPVSGSSHWAIKVEGISLVSSTAETQLPGCEGSGCEAIVDSGTSLIALPKTVIDVVLAHLGSVESDCSDVSELPTLRFRAGGHQFDLPPQLYMAKMDDNRAMEAASTFGAVRMPWHLANETRRGAATSELASTGAECLPLFMEMNFDLSSNLPAMILGLPFLRRYAARFDRFAQTVGLGEIPLGSSICTHCGTSHESNAVSSLFSDVAMSPQALVPHPHQGPRSRPVLKRAYLRMPSWMHRSAQDTRRA